MTAQEALWPIPDSTAERICGLKGKCCRYLLRDAAPLFQRENLYCTRLAIINHVPLPSQLGLQRVGGAEINCMGPPDFRRLRRPRSFDAGVC